MNIPSNLFQPIDSWTKEDVHKWFKYCIEEYSLGDINLNGFQMNGKALLMLNEDGFKQRSIRSGDILYKALQQHHALLKSLTSQNCSYSFWNHFQYIHQLNFPFSPSYFPPSFHFTNPDSSIRIRQISTSSSSSIIQPLEMKNDYIKNSQLISRNNNETIRPIQYYHDRIDFHGEILMKPLAAKNCRILWEFLYILLEDDQYQSIIHWENRGKMIFRIVQADKLAALWGLQKNRLSMTYEKLSRGMRYYYSNNIICKEPSKRLLYRFMRSPEEIRKNIKRSSNSNTMIYSTIKCNDSLPFYSPMLKSDQSSCSSVESEENEKHDYSSLKSEQSTSVTLTPCRSQLTVFKDEHVFNYKKQKLLYTLEQ